MGRNLDWLYSHATRLEQKFGVNQFLKTHHVIHATKKRFAMDWHEKVRDEFRGGWKPETLGKLIACGAQSMFHAPQSRTAMSDMQLKDYDRFKRYPGTVILEELATQVLLAALYDVTVISEGRRRSQKGEHSYVDNGRKCYHGRTIKVIDNGRQIEIPNPYWRPEAVDVSVIPDVRLAGRHEDEYPGLEPEDIHIP